MPRLALLVGGIVFSTGSFGKTVIAEPISRTQKHCQKSADKPLESKAFIKNLLEKQIPFNIVINEGYRRFCGENGLDPRNIKVLREYRIAKILHDLVKHGGIAGNLYELVEYRDKNIKKIQGEKLVPLADDAKERYPAKMMRDMFSVKPNYVSFPDKKLYSFGDCDEFEMVYVTLLGYMGIKARVVMTASNHVETLVKIRGKEFLVDNSFGKFGRKRQCVGKCTDWMTGRSGYKDKKKAKAYIDLINKRAMENIKVEVSDEASKRIVQAILSYYR